MKNVFVTSDEFLRAEGNHTMNEAIWTRRKTDWISGDFAPCFHATRSKWRQMRVVRWITDIMAVQSCHVLFHLSNGISCTSDVIVIKFYLWTSPRKQLHFAICWNICGSRHKTVVWSERLVSCGQSFRFLQFTPLTYSKITERIC
jgi:hypothetical protein